MNPTTDPSLRSFVPVSAESHFPIQNLPFGVFRPGPGGDDRVGVAIGDHVLDLSVIEQRGLFADPALQGRRVFAQPALNAFMSLGRPAWQQARSTISRLLRDDEPILRDDAELRRRALLPMDSVEVQLPAAIGDYTDFYASREHARNVGSMFRPAQRALLPNWLHLPVAYHGRASSIVCSGTDVRRPRGQVRRDDADAPRFGPSEQVDFELEVGVLIGPGNALGEPIPIESAADHIFGMVLVNDWSARDIQEWEYAPLGPFTAKNFATSVSPWVVTLEALEPFRTRGPVQDPAPLPYLQIAEPRAFDIHLQVALQSAAMDRPSTICESNFRHLYWNICQFVAHHAVTGCNLCCGDLLASGTISGPTPDSLGCLLELAWRGSRPITLSSGEQRSFLADGDRVTMTGWCQGDGYRVGFGRLTARLLPAVY